MNTIGYFEIQAAQPEKIREGINKSCFLLIPSPLSFV
jgi:hypothetical protein